MSKARLGTAGASPHPASHEAAGNTPTSPCMQFRCPSERVTLLSHAPQFNSTCGRAGTFSGSRMCPPGPPSAPRLPLVRTVFIIAGRRAHTAPQHLTRQPSAPTALSSPLSPSLVPCSTNSAHCLLRPPLHHSPSPSLHCCLAGEHPLPSPPHPSLAAAASRRGSL